MKHKFLLISFFLIISTAVSAQNPVNDSLISYYGKFRSEMLRNVCSIMELKDTALLKTIEHEDIAEFKKMIADQNDLVSKMIDIDIFNPGKIVSVSDFDSVITDLRKHFMSELLEYCKDKEQNVNQLFGPHSEIANEISAFVEETNLFENSLENYKISYPTGVYSNISACSPDKDQNRKWGVTMLLILNIILILLICGILVFIVIKYIIPKYFKKKSMHEQTFDKKIDIVEPARISGNIPHHNSPEVEKETPIDEIHQPVPDSQQYETHSFAYTKEDWIVAGASVQGNGHLSNNIPCQDSSAYESLGEGWGIAISSDGAGSAAHSQVGSKITVQRCLAYFKELVKKESWIEKSVLPTDIRWTKIAYETFKAVYNDLKKFSEAKNIEFKSLSATVIVIIHSPYGLLAAHIGDGRAGYRDGTGKWRSVITPHKGDEANQTIFITSAFWDIPFYEMSGVMVPEARVIRDTVTAFTLMSDGCENITWLYNQLDESSGRFYDPNIPFERFFEPLVKDFRSWGNNQDDQVISTKWASFVTNGNQKFIDELDDKTLILAVLKEK